MSAPHERARRHVALAGEADHAGARLQRAMDDHGFRARVESRGALAVIVPHVHPVAIDPGTRRWLVREALAAGYSHVAFELRLAADDHATVPGDHSA